jgi:hypothetical protein
MTTIRKKKIDICFHTLASSMTLPKVKCFGRRHCSSTRISFWIGNNPLIDEILIYKNNWTPDN